jgi:hypothetical protein
MINVKFTSPIIGLAETKELHPQPSKNFIPKWFKDTPIDSPEDNKYISKVKPNLRTVKKCPSFMEIFHQGYTIVSPCDIWLKYKDGQWEWKCSHPDITMNYFAYNAMAKYLPKHSKDKVIFKLANPWYVMTPKGYSSYIVPMPYTYNYDWYVQYGIIHTDTIYNMNVPIVYTSEKEEVLIKQGTPLFQLVPFKRETSKLQIIKYTHKIDKEIKKQTFYTEGSFKSKYLKNVSWK